MGISIEIRIGVVTPRGLIQVEQGILVKSLIEVLVTSAAAADAKWMHMIVASSAAVRNSGIALRTYAAVRSGRGALTANCGGDEG